MSPEILQPVADKETVSQQGAAILRPGERQSLAKFARPVEKILSLIGRQLLPQPTPYRFRARKERLPGADRPDQDGTGLSPLARSQKFRQ